MQIEMMVKGKAVEVRFCSAAGLVRAAYDFTCGDFIDGVMPVMHVYLSTFKEWACSSAPLTPAQLEEAEECADKREKDEATALSEAQAAGALDAEIWERIKRNPKDTMTTEHKKYLGLPWSRRDIIPYTQAKEILEGLEKTNRMRTQETL